MNLPVFQYMVLLFIILNLFGYGPFAHTAPHVISCQASSDSSLYSIVEYEKSKFGIIDITEKIKWAVSNRESRPFDIRGSTSAFLMWIEMENNFPVFLLRNGKVEQLKFSASEGGSVWPHALDPINKRVFVNSYDDKSLERGEVFLGFWDISESNPKKIAEVPHPGGALITINEATFTSDGKFVLFQERHQGGFCKLMLMDAHTAKLLDSIEVGAPYFLYGTSFTRNVWVVQPEKKLLQEFEIDDEAEGVLPSLKLKAKIPFGDAGCWTRISAQNILYSCCDGGALLHILKLPSMDIVSYIEYSSANDTFYFTVTQDDESIVTWKSDEIARWSKNGKQYTQSEQWDWSTIHKARDIHN